MLFGLFWLKSFVMFLFMIIFDIGGLCNKDEDCDDSKFCIVDVCTNNKCVNDDIVDCCIIEVDCDDESFCM